ncbi:aminotransferase class III-fold pyridoxal phosphate-dependent enzyme [Chitinophaga sancti]|uniref:Aminotransferase class III-fold pyridoxal phosphate-dependent enzyme n=1 Tax=Chitinophaga sancti TaxID=1004 RepID=A0A1K1QXK9_9BACT|nr:aminotransferase class III-fold pyridoxal phosphate-dependent enzyme [Chitinophaga sancti]WQD62035.1 aminotransferase class III-fold pyridoxal phosphate-dependent enzyme [Chitinophaga sancti]WQG92396.1 aminotransferase class III-fold pyridoxal phosphate-dependent enzyme [Chitinophaga sancti]SFW64420.1 taurine---2-oxoglutarate transaminase [Chitinophaga sancti]
MSAIVDLSTAQEIIQDNLDYTLFSWSKQKGLQPIAVKHAEGVYLYDYDDKRYLDFSSGLMNVNIGHGNQRVTEAVMRQMQAVSYVTPGCVTAARGELGKKLAAISPGNLTKTLFTVCGASAIENAVKLARLYTGRHKIITRYRAFHGASYVAMSAGGDPRKLAVDAQQAPNFVHVEDPYCYRCPWGKEMSSCSRECVSHVERVIEFEGPENVAAILMEGESGSSGCIKYPPDYLQKIRAICDKHGILLIADEVMSGFGRTGKWFACDVHGVVPDMIATAKGITAGYLPLGALIVSDQIAAHFDERTLWLGLTYSAHPVCCAAGVEVLQIYEDEHLLENAARMGEYVKARVEEMKTQHPSIGDFRTTGLLGCIELVKNRETKEPMAPFNAKPEEMMVMNKVAGRIKQLGMYAFVRWNYVFIAPPLSITKEQMDEGLAIIDDALGIADEYVS